MSDINPLVPALYGNNLQVNSTDIVAVMTSTYETKLNKYISATQKAVKDRKARLVQLNKDMDAAVEAIANAFTAEVKILYGALADKTGSSAVITFEHSLVNKKDNLIEVVVTSKIEVQRRWNGGYVEYAESILPVTPEVQTHWETIKLVNEEVNTLAGDLARLQSDKRNIAEVERAAKAQIAYAALSQSEQGMAHLEAIKEAAEKREGSFADLFVQQKKLLEG
jgi:hypothetical protein